MKDLKWVKSAMILVLAFFLAVLLVKPIGVSTQFNVLSGIVHNSLDSDLISENPENESGYESSNSYYNRNEGKLAKRIKHPFNYDFIFVLSIPLGAYIASKIVNKDKPVEEIKEDDLNNLDSLTMKDESFFEKYLSSFISGFLILFGARMAGGCTSGHMMSGIMQGSISGFIFAAAVFMVAIPVSIFTSNKSSQKGGNL